MLFFVDVRLYFSGLVTNPISISDTNDMEIGTALNVSFEKQNAELPVSKLFQ
jgi:hypothetical protein